MTKRDYYEILGVGKDAPKALRSLGEEGSASIFAKATVDVRGVFGIREAYHG